MKTAEQLVKELHQKAGGMSVTTYALRWPIAKEILRRKEETAPIFLEMLRSDHGWMLDVTFLEAMFPEADPYVPEEVGAGFVGYKVKTAMEAWVNWGIENGLIKA